MTLHDSIKSTLGINKITLVSEKPKQKSKSKKDDWSSPLSQSILRSLGIWGYVSDEQLKKIEKGWS